MILKNKSYSPINIIVDGKSVILPARKSMQVNSLTKQIISLKNSGLIHIKK